MARRHSRITFSTPVSAVVSAVVSAIVVSLLCGALVLPGCGSAGDAGPIVLYDTSATRPDFFALPWPSDARLRGTGDARTLDLAGFHDPGAIIGEYLRLLGSEPQGGFGTSAGIFFRFDGPIDPASLPGGPAASVAAGASVFVVDVTPGSPTVGQRAPVRVAFVAEDNDYIGANHLVLLPAPGFPLRPRTTYAAIVTDAVRGPGGGAVQPDARFVLPAFPVAPGVDLDHIAGATVFTTGDPTVGMRALREAVHDSGPAPAIDPGSLKYAGLDLGKLYDRYQGTYAAPIFQQGEPPYLRTGGGIAFTDGKPAIARVEHLRIALSVPRTAMPAGGWPIVLYAHGTGGDWESFIEDSSAFHAASVSDDGGGTIGRMAMISIDQPLHGPRDPSMGNPEVTTYNFQNLPAARDGFRQGAADDFQLVRLVKSINVASAPVTGKPLRFDGAHIGFKGHSQGGTTGALFVASEPEVKAAVLSGAGANLIESLLHKTQPVNIPQILEAVVGEPVDAFHPLLSLVQTYLEPADPGNYARLLVREPPAGHAPKNVFVSLGVVDHYTPMVTTVALALAAGLQPVTPDLTPASEPGVAELLGLVGLAGQRWGDPPLTGNVAAGKATGVLCQYQVPVSRQGTPWYDGHFVVFRTVAAVRQSSRFLATAVRDGLPTLVP